MNYRNIIKAGLAAYALVEFGLRMKKMADDMVAQSAANTAEEVTTVTTSVAHNVTTSQVFLDMFREVTVFGEEHIHKEEGVHGGPPTYVFSDVKPGEYTELEFDYNGRIGCFHVHRLKFSVLEDGVDLGDFDEGSTCRGGDTTFFWTHPRVTSEEDAANSVKASQRRKTELARLFKPSRTYTVQMKVMCDNQPRVLFYVRI